MTEASWRESVRRHYTDHPDTWIVVKKAERYWTICDAADTYIIDQFTTKRDAEAALESGSMRKTWEDLDSWYRQESKDPRNRPLKDWEVDAVAEILAELGA